jgi:Ni/Co efflux regulator RcnB
VTHRSFGQPLSAWARAFGTTATMTRKRKSTSSLQWDNSRAWQSPHHHTRIPQRESQCKWRMCSIQQVKGGGICVAILLVSSQN